MAETAVFCRERESYCHRAEAVPQIGLILSTDAYYTQNSDIFCAWDDIYTPFEGILCNLLDRQNSVEILMEHQLAERIDEYPLLVFPEWRVLKPALNRQLVDYVRKGGNLLVVGPESSRHFRQELKVRFKRKAKERACFVEANGWIGGALTLVQEVEPLRGAKVQGWLYEHDEASGLRIPAATVARLGKGRIAAIYMNMGERYANAKTAVACDFLNGLVRVLFPEPLAESSARRSVQAYRCGREGKPLDEVPPRDQSDPPEKAGD